MRGRLKKAIRNQGFQPPRWAILINPFFIVRRALYLKIKAIAPGFSGHVLDFGCGSKPFANLFVSARSYLGVDVAVSGHDHAESNIDVFYDGNTLPFEKARFDHVVAFEVFEHVFNLDHVLAEIKRVIKPGGDLLFSVPFGWDEHERPYDFARYTTFGLKHILQTAGFDVVSIERTNGFVSATGQLAILYMYFITRTRNGLLNKIAQILILFPLTLLTVLLKKALPHVDTFFSGVVVLARVPQLEVANVQGHAS